MIKVGRHFVAAKSSLTVRTKQLNRSRSLALTKIVKSEVKNLPATTKIVKSEVRTFRQTSTEADQAAILSLQNPAWQSQQNQFQSPEIASRARSESLTFSKIVKSEVKTLQQPSKAGLSQQNQPKNRGFLPKSTSEVWRLQNSWKVRLKTCQRQQWWAKTWSTCPSRHFVALNLALSVRHVIWKLSDETKNQNGGFRVTRGVDWSKEAKPKYYNSSAVLFCVNSITTKKRKRANAVCMCARRESSRVKMRKWRLKFWG